jgi:LacI family transcriptional regulator
MRDPGGRLPTLSDVAMRANVSKQTASRVVNNKGEVSEATRQRVLEVIREIGYSPNTLARSLVTNRTFVIGLSVPNIDQPFYPQIARGVEDAANERGYSVFLCNAAGDLEREVQALERLRGNRVEGIISFNSRLTDTMLDRAVGGVVPMVLINRELPDNRGTVIWPGYETGGRLVAEHFASLGRRRPGYLGLEHDSNVDGDKLRGFTCALAAAGIALDPARVVRIPSRLGRSFNALVQAGYDAMGMLLTRGADVDALFASNDLTAIGAIRHAIARGIAIPEEIAVVGFGAANVSGYVTPSLSTISMPLYEMGYTAFQALLSLIGGAQREPQQVTIQPQLVARASSLASP